MLEAFFQTLASTPFGVFMQQQNVYALAPELILSMTLILTLCLSMNDRKEDRQGAWGLSLLGVLLALVTLALQGTHFLGNLTPEASSLNVLFGMLRLDGLAWVARTLMLSSTVVLLLMCRSYVRERLASVAGEFYTLLLTALLGGLFLCSASDLVMLFISMETLGITSYLLVGYLRNNAASSEASLKYLLYGGASSAIFLFGLSILYGLLGGSTQLSQLAALSPVALKSLQPFVPFMVVMLTAGMGFKLSAAPFQWWTPDVYEGSPTPVTAFLSVISKIAGFAFVIRLVSLLLPLFPDFSLLLALLSVVSMVLGNAVALFQSNIKRLLAYSTVAHVGYLLLGLVVFTKMSLAGVWYYLAAYAFMNLGAFACVMQASNALGSDDIKDYAGLVRKKPFLVGAFAIFLLSLAGLPITSGFFAKFFLFQSLIFTSGVNLIWVIIALLASTVSLAYYLKVLHTMVVQAPSPQVEAIHEAPGFRLRLPSTLTTAVSLCVAATLILGFIAPPIYQSAQTALTGLIQAPAILSSAQ
jgi:NAD(P)H-quinone oxidoreductase subunit 2